MDCGTCSGMGVPMTTASRSDLLEHLVVVGVLLGGAQAGGALGQLVLADVADGVDAGAVGGEGVCEAAAASDGPDESHLEFALLGH